MKECRDMESQLETKSLPQVDPQEIRATRRHFNRFALRRRAQVALAMALVLVCWLLPVPFQGADHNDPNGVNSIFTGTDVSAADLYDFFGWPSDDTTGGEKAVLALTFASVPQAGVLDPDLLYRILVAPTPRYSPQASDEASLATMLKYVRA